MTTLYTTLYTAVAQAVSSFATSESLPVLYPGVGGNPPDTGLWLELRFFYNDTLAYGLADGGPSLVDGFIRIGVADQPHGGIVAALEIVDKIASAFDKGYVIDEDSNTRIYEAPSVSGVLELDDRVLVPVTLRFRGTYVAAP